MRLNGGAGQTGTRAYMQLMNIGIAGSGADMVKTDKQTGIGRLAGAWQRYDRPARAIALVVAALLLSACVSTGPEKRQVQRVKAGDSNCAATAAGKPGCGPQGVIEVTENYGVDPEVRREFDQAVVLLNEGKYPEAIRLLKAVAGKTSKFSAPHINLGIAYVRTNELEKAEQSFKAALKISRQHPVAQNELGLVYRKTGRYKEARQLYESLLGTYPDFLPARKNLGVLCDIYIQDLGCALEQYEEYLRGKPDDEKVKIWVADVKSRM